MHTEANRAAWAEIDLGCVDFNIKEIAHKVGGASKVIGVIKSDAYGHGAAKIAQLLSDNGICSFAVATLPEAIELRESGFTDEEIIPFSLIADSLEGTVVEYNLSPLICSFYTAEQISEEAAKKGKIISGYIAVDTGMGRVGYNPDVPETIEEIVKINELSNFRIKGLFSHMSTADEADKSYANWQAKRFKAFADKLESMGVSLPVKTFANSAAIVDMPETYYDKSRAGLILFGYYPSDEVDKSALSLKPAMSVKASIIQLKEVEKGTAIGYNRKFIADRKSRIATIPLGYADGLPRTYSPFAKVLVNGIIAPVAGNICMDQCMIDVTDVPEVKEGDEVIIIGSDGRNQITADDIAKATNTIPNEILCGFGQRLYKKYV